MQPHDDDDNDDGGCDGIAFNNIYANPIYAQTDFRVFNPILSNGPAKLFLYVGQFGDLLVLQSS